MATLAPIKLKRTTQAFCGESQLANWNRPTKGYSFVMLITDFWTGSKTLQQI